MGMTFALVVHIFISIALIGIVLVQRGKGADMGAAFGAGASGTVFGSKGSGNFLTRTTAVLATGFFVTSLILAFMALEQQNVTTDNSGSVVTQQLQEQASQPADVPSLSTEGVSSGSSEAAVPTLSTEDTQSSTGN